MNDIVAMDRLAAFHVNSADVKSLKAAVNSFIDWVEPNADLPHLVYLSRARLGREGKRHTTNADAIIAIVERQGGKVLYPETMSLHDQVSYMKGAKLVICDAGASIANAIFCGSDCAFIILTQSHARPNLFMSYVQALGLRIGFVYGHAIDMPGIGVAHLNIEVPIDRIEKAIAFFKPDRGSGEPDGWH
jgi:capsular polysaccharide biosynthesis protein